MDKNLKDLDFNIIRWFNFQGSVSILEAFIRLICGYVIMAAWNVLTANFVQHQIIASLCAMEYRAGSAPYRHLFDSYEQWYMTILLLILVTLIFSTAAKRVNSCDYDSEKLKYAWCFLSGTLVMRAFAFAHINTSFPFISDIFYVTDALSSFGAAVSLIALIFIIIVPPKQLGISETKDDNNNNKQ